MLDFLINIDEQLFLFLNGLHNPFWDQVMWVVSSKTFWIPFYVVLAAWIVYRYRKASWLILLAIGLLISAADHTSVHYFKMVFERYRPSQQEALKDLVHIVNDYRGGAYGFVSSHAANTFALAAFTALIFRIRWYTWGIFFWAAFVSYSRIYLGVHFPFDIIGGALLGIFLGWLFYLLVNFLNKRFLHYQSLISAGDVRGSQ